MNNNQEWKNTSEERWHIMCHPSRLKKDSKQVEIKVVQRLGDCKKTNGVKKLVCYSLWGTRSVYAEGAFTNAELVPIIYGKDWTVRIYVANDVPESTILKLLSLNAQVYIMNTDSKSAGSVGAFWRLLPMGEKNTIMLSRDLDSRVSYREFLAVKKWLTSDMSFHRMYDSNMDAFNKFTWRGTPCKVPFYAGMFGAKSQNSRSIVPNIQNLINKWNYKFMYGGEELFLAKIILNIARKKGVFTHIMKGHSKEQGSLFLNPEDKQEQATMMKFASPEHMRKYFIHQEYFKDQPGFTAKSYLTFTKVPYLLPPRLRK